jgi:hypothetical protein
VTVNARLVLKPEVRQKQLKSKLGYVVPTFPAAAAADLLSLIADVLVAADPSILTAGVLAAVADSSELSAGTLVAPCVHSDASAVGS